MLYLPAIRPAVLKSFWLVLSLTVGSFSFCIFGSLSFGAGAVTVLGILAVAYAGIRWPRIAYPAYRLYNILARQISRYGSLLILSICFYIILAAVSRKKSSVTLSRPLTSQSLWGSLSPIIRDAYRSQSPIVTNNLFRQGWLAVLFSWAVQSRRLWVCCLLPLLGLLALLGDEQENTVSADLYTLF